MRIVDSHFHWWPRSVFEYLCKRSTFPYARPNDKGGYLVYVDEGSPLNGGWAEWYELDALMAHEQKQGFETDLVLSTGPISATFSHCDPAIGIELCRIWNDEMAAAVAKHPGHLWASGVVPLSDTKLAIDELDRCVDKLGLIGVNIPGSIGRKGRIDEERLEPFYDRVEELKTVIFMHPSDSAFQDILDGYNGALYNSLGRVIDLSVATYRMVLSGIMERHPDLKIFASHMGGALPYQAGRMDKNSKAAKLPRNPSEYLRRFYTDTVMPHALGMKMAIEFYGVDHVMYGDDYPCWNPEGALKILKECGLNEADREKIMNTNARRILNLKQPVEAKEPVAA
jgi:aminocarboxymuconate-semialdehyde decarboxylase